MKSKTLFARLRAAVEALGGTVDAAIVEAREQGLIEAALEVDRLQAELLPKSPGAKGSGSFAMEWRAYANIVKAIEERLSADGRRRLVAARLSVARAGITSFTRGQPQPS